MAIEFAWVQFAPGATPTVNTGKKINSVARNGVGDYSINLTDDLVGGAAGSTARASVGGASGFPTQAALAHVKCEMVSARQVRVRTRNFAGALADQNELSVVIRSDLAPASE